MMNDPEYLPLEFPARFMPDFWPELESCSLEDLLDERAVTQNTKGEILYVE